MLPNKTVRQVRAGPAVSSLAAILAFFDLSIAGMAQEAPGDEQVNVIDEIIVTARRREESLWTVPGSVSAFSGQQLRDLQATDMRQVQYAVPNFHFQRSDSSNAAVYLRGIGQNDSLPFVEPGVGVYVDDVYVARTQAAFVELFDIERVEVLRGPQGTLYGRNSPGGAVKLITRQPSDEYEALRGGGRRKSQRPHIQHPHQRALEQRRPLERETVVRRNPARRVLRERGPRRDRRRYRYAVVPVGAGLRRQRQSEFRAPLRRKIRASRPLADTEPKNAAHLVSRSGRRSLRAR